MSDQPPRVRRTVPEKPPEDTSGRRGCMLVGGALGIIAGALLALFALPPLFDRYFGVADIELGKAYEGDAKVIRVIEASRQPGADGQQYPGVFVVRLEVTSNKTWAPAPSDFELELTTGGDNLPLLSSVPALGALPLAETFELRLTFAGTERHDAQPSKLHLATPHLRFHLQPGKPK